MAPNKSTMKRKNKKILRGGFWEFLFGEKSKTPSESGSTLESGSTPGSTSGSTSGSTPAPAPVPTPALKPASTMPPKSDSNNYTMKGGKRRSYKKSKTQRKR